MRRGFTLLELIIVIIIIGVLATLGITQYTRAIEKGRSAEAKSNLGAVRSQQVAYYLDKGTYASITNLGVGLPDGVGASCSNAEYYFQYSCAVGTGTCTAYRCTAGGKTPNGSTAYNITLTIAGVWGGTEGYY